MKFTTRIILVTGLSTLLLTSLYWFAGWHLVESAEEASRERVLEYIAAQPGLEGVDITPLLDEPDSSETMERALVIGGILLFSFGAMGITLILIWQQTRPLRELMQAIEAVDPASPQLTPLQRRDELGEMSRRFSQLLQRIDGFIQREQNFTRFASHELRSPLMVIHSSLELLQGLSENRPDLEQRALNRIAQALSRMEQLTDSFLWLSREQASDTCRIDAAKLEQLLAQLAPSRCHLQSHIQPPINWSVHPFVLSVILDNLLSNAQRHGCGEIELRASGRDLSLRNPVARGSNAKAPGQGFGYGLPIIRQLCEKAGAEFHHEQDGDHFLARIRFQPSTPSTD